MKHFGRVFRCLLLLFLAAFLMGVASLPSSAQEGIPEGSTINSAVVYLYKTSYWGTTLWAHRITADWNEGTVTWNTFNNSYHPDVIASFIVPEGHNNWCQFNITDLVQQWINNTYPNFGIVVRQQVPPVAYHWDHFYSSEYADQSYRPYIVINYTTPSGTMGSITLRRPAIPDPPGNLIVYDASVYQLYPNSKYNGELLYACLVPQDSNYLEKYTLIRFDITIIPRQGDQGCTPGYWKNHLSSWAVTGYSTSDYFNSIFGVSVASNPTLGQAIQAKGGGINVILRHGTAALLSAAHPDVNYPYSVPEVISMVQAAILSGGNIDNLIEANELGCYIPRNK